METIIMKSGITVARINYEHNYKKKIQLAIDEFHWGQV